MNGDQHEGFHYIDTGFPYIVAEGFMDLFHGITYAQSHALTGSPQDQGSPYWSMMHFNPYRYGHSGSSSSSYYSFSHTYDINDHSPRLSLGRVAWDSRSSVNAEELPAMVCHDSGNDDVFPFVSTEECIQTRQTTNDPQTTSNPQVLWEDNVDPDSMTYEELLDLGEAVGTQNRGLTQDLISLLPISKFKCSFFSRKKRQRERCVICQMDYKRGDRQMTLPCTHVYHATCASKWLSINKACPVCFTEVFGDKPRR